MKSRRRWLAPEVVQTSMMDCGPASMKCILEGFGVHVSFGRLREACRTDVDGTSIDTLEVIAQQLGLAAEQVMLPVDHLLLPEAAALPALVVVRVPSGFLHFVVVWGVTAGMVQIMDPAAGRRWVSRARFLQDLHVHTQVVPAEGFREWAMSDAFRAPFLVRLARLGARQGLRAAFDAALASSDWRPIATLDAAARMIEAVVSSGGLRRGSEATRVVANVYERALVDPEIIPAQFWTARTAPADEEGTAQVHLRGAVLVTIEGVAKDLAKAKKADASNAEGASSTEAPLSPLLSPELAAALAEPPDRPGRALWRLLRADGLLTPAALTTGLVVASAVTATEAIFFRALLDVGRSLGPIEQRVAAVGFLMLFLVLGLALEWPIVSGTFGLGRRLEARLRMAFLRKLPRLEDQYFQSRPVSDMAERSHGIHAIRTLPTLVTRFLRTSFELVATCVGIVWIDRQSAPLVLAVAACAMLPPILATPLLIEREMRARTHLGAMARFYLDAMLGLLAIRTHGAERALRREHEGLLVEWVRASRSVLFAAISSRAVEAITTCGLTIALVLGYLARNPEPGGVLLLVYWALAVPALGQELAVLVRQYPAHRNATLRMLEPLGAREAETSEEAAGVTTTREGVSIVFDDVSIVAAGNPVLTGINLAVRAGEHIAIIGASGSGKSTLVGTLLGWYRAAAGAVTVDGRTLDPAGTAKLRLETAWVDPGVQLWNRSLLDNLRYGHPTAPSSYAAVLDAADLHDLLESLPDGLRTSLGEGGALVSGGEGQRARFGRALLRGDARLAVLDEPFRGLDREKRRALTTLARKWWSSATMLFVTHDVVETRAFDRVVVVADGTIVEDGAPEELLARPDGRYRAMVEAERHVHETVWQSGVWRRVTVARGKLTEAPRLSPDTRDTRETRRTGERS